MINTIVYLTNIACVGIVLFISLCVLIWSFICLHEYITNRIKTKKITKMNTSFHLKFDEMKRYCGSEFPIVEDISSYIHNNAFDIVNFRDFLRIKYKNKE